MAAEHIRHWRIGDVEIARIVEVYGFEDDISMLLPDATPAYLQQFKWLVPHFATPDGRMIISFQCFVLRSKGRTAMIDTCIGNDRQREFEVFCHMQNSFLEDLAGAGFPADQVTDVLCTHLHFDHCGWNTVRTNGRVLPTFPRATYYAPEGEWQHGQKQHLRDRVSYISDNYNPLIQSGHMKLVKEDREIIPGVSVRTIPGHTRYMQVVMIESQGQKACYVSDLIPTAAHLDLLWIMAYDLFPMEIIENKKRFYEEAIPGRWLVIFTHDPAIPWGYVKEMGTGKYGMEQVSA
jgi:glyoxylase-like metal-dependent hydrolase (beta-lactamase superfamily II)